MESSGTLDSTVSSLQTLRKHAYWFVKNIHKARWIITQLSFITHIFGKIISQVKWLTNQMLTRIVTVNYSVEATEQNVVWLFPPAFCYLCICWSHTVRNHWIRQNAEKYFFSRLIKSPNRLILAKLDVLAVSWWCGIIGIFGTNRSPRRTRK